MTGNGEMVFEKITRMLVKCHILLNLTFAL